MVGSGLLLLLVVAAAIAGTTANHTEEEVQDPMVPAEVLDGMGRSGAGLDSALELWEPRVLAKAWPHLAPRLRPACHRHLAQWMRALAQASDTPASDGDAQPDLWALRVLDASGRYSRRLHSGNDFWLGSRDLCGQLDVAATGGDSDLSPRDIPPFRFDFHVAKIHMQLDLLSRTRLIHLGVCVPATCDVHDTSAMLSALADVRGGRTVERNVTIDAIRVVGGANSYSFSKDSRFSAMLGASIIISILVIVATIYDFWLIRKPIHEQKGMKILENNNNSNYNQENDTVEYNYDKQIITTDGSASVNLNLTTFSNGTLCNENRQKNGKHLPTGEKNPEEWKWRDDVEADSVSTQLLLSFSLRTNLQKLCSLSGGDDTLTPIHGLRVFTLMWIVLVHVCLITFQNADNKKFRMKAEQDFLYQTLSSGTYSVDTFFVISGMLVSFLYFRTVSKMSSRELTFSEGYKAGILQFIGMTIYRFIRLTPTYLYVLGIVSLSTKYFYDQSVMELPTRDHITCDKYWWRNILYINTYSTEEERCMAWSWYLANDTQFYTFGSILLIIAVSYFQIAVAIAGIVLLSTWTTTAVITINTQHRPSIEDPFANYTDLYDKPWTRIGPYLIGMCAGWLLCKINCQLNLHKGWIVFGWVTALSTMCSVVYGLYLIEFGPVLSAVYVALGHSAWALSIAWVVIACSTNNGGIADKILSWPYLYPISRLSYCTYLIHPQVIRIILWNYDIPFHLTIGMMGAVFGGFLLTSYFAALLITLTFEAPVVSLLRIIHPMSRRKSS